LGVPSTIKRIKLKGASINLDSLLPHRQESGNVKSFWIPAFAGMTFLEEALRLKASNDRHSARGDRQNFIEFEEGL